MKLNLLRPTGVQETDLGSSNKEASQSVDKNSGSSFRAF